MEVNVVLNTSRIVEEVVAVVAIVQEDMIDLEIALVSHQFHIGSFHNSHYLV